nr:unnamed protein product [Callosobruchus analis]
MFVTYVTNGSLVRVISIPIRRSTLE